MATAITVLSNGKNLKVAFSAIYAYIFTNHASLLADPAFLDILGAKAGGFGGEDSFVTIDGVKVGRVCAMTGAVYAHNNTDKVTSFFYKNGSYMIGAEIVKANERKAWEIDKEARELDLEDQMLEGSISPKEWKAEANLIKAGEFSFSLSDSEKNELILDFNGYDSKEAFTEAFNNDEVAPFTDYDEVVKALRELAPTKPKAQVGVPLEEVA